MKIQPLRLCKEVAWQADLLRLEFGVISLEDQLMLECLSFKGRRHERGIGKLDGNK